MNAKNESFQLLYDVFQNIKFTTLKPCKGDEFYEDLVGKSKNLRDNGKKIITSLKENLFSRKPESYLNDLHEMKRPIRTLIDLVRSFAVQFMELKKKKDLSIFQI